MAEVVRRAGVTFAMGYTWRFLNGLRKVREIVHSGQLGTVRFARALCTSLTPASQEVWRIDPVRASSWAMSRTGTHGLDLYRWYFGEPTDVKAAVVSPRDGGNDELAVVILTFPDGLVAELVVSVLFPGNSIEVYGDKGTLVGQNPFRHGQVPDPSVPGAILSEAGKFRLNGEPVTYEQADAFAAEVADFVNAVRTGQPPTTGLEDGLRNMEIMERVVQR
jgi:predicted dehydrogenase